MEIAEKIAVLDWATATGDLDNNGYAILPAVLTPGQCEAFIARYADDSLYRKRVVMERHQYGKGEYKYFNYPLPPLLQQLRENIYPRLAPVANGWMQALGKPLTYPPELYQLLELCHAAGQLKPTPLILQYRQGGYNALHQDLYGEMFFPVQAVIFLNEADIDHTGGEFVLVEQKPRAQSRAIVLKPKKGDILIFTTNFRPVKGKSGYYRVNMKHGVSGITGGVRHTLGIIFHDAS
jgi:hypothetical protein